MSIANSRKITTLRIEVPISAFRPHESREYQDTHPFPPPSAVYGMLLSLSGIHRERKAQHLGVQMALAIEELPERARVFRKFRRGKELGEVRPDYQDLLIDLRLWVWLAQGSDQGEPPLIERVITALSNPQHPLERSGGLSLGESSYLIDTISIQIADEDMSFVFLKPDPAGFYHLPIWVDHTSNQNVRQRFSLERMTACEGLAHGWITIAGAGPTTGDETD